MKNISLVPAEQIDYDLMALNVKPTCNLSDSGPENLVLRKPDKNDFEQIFLLQAAYEKEEVLPKGAEFSPSACRLNLERLLKTEKMLLACTGEEIIGKINTNAKSFTRYQIGGVYVKPSFRRKGIAARMTAAFLEELISDNTGASLFVKKSNAAARAVYEKTGFIAEGDYRICYF